MIHHAHLAHVDEDESEISTMPLSVTNSLETSTDEVVQQSPEMLNGTVRKIRKSARKPGAQRPTAAL